MKTKPHSRRLADPIPMQPPLANATVLSNVGMWLSHLLTLIRGEGG